MQWDKKRMVRILSGVLGIAALLFALVKLPTVPGVYAKHVSGKDNNGQGNGQGKGKGKNESVDIDKNDPFIQNAANKSGCL